MHSGDTLILSACIQYDTEIVIFCKKHRNERGKSVFNDLLSPLQSLFGYFDHRRHIMLKLIVFR